uniref:Uncharacterized protein n=1 Tax=Glossina austeni TaxID=7395 RepID=A0A1A9VSQ7_GLOAU
MYNGIMKNDDDESTSKDEKTPLTPAVVDPICMQCNQQTCNPTISALVRGLHNTSITDANCLQKPLSEKEMVEQPIDIKIPVAHPLGNRRSASASSPKSWLVGTSANLAINSLKIAEGRPHSSLPRFIINIEPPPDDDEAVDDDDGQHLDVPPSPNSGRRFSQFNFNFRRLSHTNLGENT